MQTSEASIEYLEAHSQNWLSVDNGKIIEVFPDATFKTIKQIDQLIPLTPRHKQAS